MMPRRISVCLIPFLLVAAAAASDPKSPGSDSTASPHLTRQTREDLIRAFLSELVYIRAPFPMGKTGLTVKDGVISPSGQQLQMMIATWGPSVKPGDQARISSINVKSDRIHFEINGGPVKKPKWYQRIEVGGAGGSAPIAPSDASANPRGSYVDLIFDRYVPEMSPQQLKLYLRPVFDFDSKSPVDAYLETVPPKIKEAIKNHQVLVGMNREMVTYAKGRAPKKIREKEGDTEYEDWVYGEPPQDVDFIRLVGDEVVRVETMKVDGEKIVRTEKEVDLSPKPTVAKASETQRPANAPSLRRPCEELPNDRPATMPSGGVAPAPPPTSAPDPGAGSPTSPPPTGPN